MVDLRPEGLLPFDGDGYLPTKNSVHILEALVVQGGHGEVVADVCGTCTTRKKRGEEGLDLLEDLLPLLGVFVSEPKLPHVEDNVVGVHFLVQSTLTIVEVSIASDVVFKGLNLSSWNDEELFDGEIGVLDILWM